MTAIFFLLLFSINFFGVLTLPNSVLLGTILAITVWKKGFSVKTPFNKPIRWMFIGILLSFIPACLYREQAMMETFKASAEYFYLLLFFTFAGFSPSLSKSESALEKLAILFSILYILQFVLLQRGINIIGVSDDAIDSGLEARFRMSASGLSSLGLLYAANKFILTKNIRYIFIGILCCVPIILMAFRTMIFFSAVAVVLTILIINKTNFLKSAGYLILISILCILVLQIPVIAEKVDYMVERQLEGTDTFQNVDYIRWIALDYYYNEYPQHMLERFLGSGQPFVGTKFHDEQLSLWQVGIFYMDWGLLGLSWLIGPISVLAMIWYSLKTWFVKIGIQYVYLRIWFLFLVLSSITTTEFSRPGNFAVQALALYLVYKASLKFRQPDFGPAKHHSALR